MKRIVIGFLAIIAAMTVAKIFGFTSILVELVLAVAFIALYFLPTYVANNRHKNNTPAIFVLNLFLGWTLLGWVGALVWAMSQDKPTVAIV